MRKIPLASCIAVLCLLQGCATTSPLSSAPGGYDSSLAPVPLRSYLDATWADGEWGAVLNFNRLGLAALETGEYAVAERAFDASLARIEAIYADNPGAKKARSVWTPEGSKDFKGEPYERAMAYYYRGLLYLRAGDFDNARAAFRSAEYQDTLSEAETFQGDFALMPLLAGWASRCSGDEGLARSYYEQARAQHPSLPLPLPGEDALVLVETGNSPTKTAEGQYGEQLVVRPPDWVGSVPGGVGSHTIADLGFQATTRGGRPVDRILAGKAQFKETTGTVGDVALATSQAALQAAAFMPADQMGDMANFGAAAGLIGLFASAMSSNAEPKSDTRYWDNLPAMVYGGFASRDGVQGPVGVQPVLDAVHPGCRVTVYRDASGGSVGGRGNLTEQERAKVLKRNRGRDAAFRSEFAASFRFEPPVSPALEASASVGNGSPQ